MHGARRLKPSERLSSSARYELLLRLAAGGMGAVFVGAPRMAAGPLYAIKRAHPHLAEHPDFRKMFVAEARLARRIGHPNAIGVIDVDESDGELLMVMRYVEGGSLSDMLQASYARGRRIAPQVTLRVIVDAARGLDAAHEVRDESGRALGIVHRDVSPHNILVGVDGVAAIVDFGVAKAVSLEMTSTATDVLKGKSAYMAPEYVKARVANPQTDVFALGVVAWEALANRRLFKGEDELATMARLLDAAPAPMLHEIVEADATVAAVIARALAKDPAKRFPTARGFADALEAAAASADQLGSPVEVAATVKSLLAADLAERRELLATAAAERSAAGLAPSLQSPLPSTPPIAPRDSFEVVQATTRVATIPRRVDAAQLGAERTVAAASPRAALQATAPMNLFAAQRSPSAAPGAHLAAFEAPAATVAMDLGAPLEAAAPTWRTPSPLASSRRMGVAAGVAVAVVTAIAGAVLLVPAVRRDRDAAPSSAAAEAPPATEESAPPRAGAPIEAPPVATADPSAEPAASAAADPSSDPSSAPSGSAAPAASASASSAPSARAPAGGRPAASGWRPKANPY